MSISKPWVRYSSAIHVIQTQPCSPLSLESDVSLPSVDGARRDRLETERRTEASQNTVTTPHPSLTCLYCNYASEEGSRKIRGESIPRPACTCSACWTSEVVHAMHISCVMGRATFVPVRPLSPELLDLKEGVRVLHLRAVEAGQVDLAIDGDARIGCERDHVAQ